ncbi:DUF6286 domain-containing protein [Streptomyces sp. NPDC051563]|uniref:DUF6286 domain-containing protein n=1 Tax=Streptomyces sp. NPDC051563 TaxID=3365659 RepID=UPI00378E9013
MTARRRGTTTIADRVVRRIAEQAAREAAADHGGSVTGGAATVRGRSAQVRVDIALAYRGSAGDAARAVQEHLAARTSLLTGMSVPVARIRIRKLTATAAPPTGPTDGEADGGPDAGSDAGSDAGPGVARGPAPDRAPGPAPDRSAGKAPGRPWSGRRLPVAGVAALVLAGAGSLLWDAAVAQGQGTGGGTWRRQLTGWLTGHGPAETSPWAAAVLALAGLWLITLALTPGRRRDLVLVAPGPAARAVISRRSAARLIHAGLTARLPGLTRARVRVSRRRLTVRAELACAGEAKLREREAVTQAVTAAARDLDLAAPLRTSVRVRDRDRDRDQQAGLDRDWDRQPGQDRDQGLDRAQDQQPGPDRAQDQQPGPDRAQDQQPGPDRDRDQQPGLDRDLNQDQGPGPDRDRTRARRLPATATEEEG